MENYTLDASLKQNVPLAPVGQISITVELGKDSFKVFAFQRGKFGSNGHGFKFGNGDKDWGNPILVGMQVIKLTDLKGASEQLNQFVRDIHKSAKNGSFGSEKVEYILCVPRRLVTTRFLELPSTNIEELRMMARFQAISDLPFPEEDLVSDLLIQSQDAKTKSTKVLLVIARKSALEPYFGLFEQLGTFPDRFVLSSSSLESFVRKIKGFNFSNYTHVDFNKDWMEIDIYRNRELMITRSIPLVLNAEAPERILKECSLSLQSIPSLIRNPVQAILITGIPQSQMNLATPLKSGFDTHVEFIDLNDPSAQASSLTLSMNKSADLSKMDPGDLVTAMGAASASEDQYIDLMPDQMKIEKKTKKIRRQLKNTGFWLGGWALLMILIMGLDIFLRKHTLSQLEEQIKRIEPQAKKVSELIDKSSFLKAQMNVSASPLETLRELHRIVPGNINLSNITYDVDGKLILQGTAGRLSQVMDLIGLLNKSRLFSKAELVTSNSRTIQSQERVDFQLQCHIEAKAL